MQVPRGTQQLRDPRIWLQVSVTASKGEASLNPGAVSGHVGIDAWTVGQGTALAPAHHAHQDPTPGHHTGQGSPRVTLQENGKLRSQLPGISDGSSGATVPTGCLWAGSQDAEPRGGTLWVLGVRE